MLYVTVSVYDIKYTRFPNNKQFEYTYACARDLLCEWLDVSNIIKQLLRTIFLNVYTRPLYDYDIENAHTVDSYE